LFLFFKGINEIPEYLPSLFSVSPCATCYPFPYFWLREREGIAIVISGAALENTLSYCIYYVFVFINHNNSQPIEYL